MWMYSWLWSTYVLSRSEKRRDDVHEKNLHDGHARKDRGVSDVRPVGRGELIRVGENRRIATCAGDNAGHFVVRYAKNKEAQSQGRPHGAGQHDGTQAQHGESSVGDGRRKLGP